MASEIIKELTAIKEISKVSGEQIPGWVQRVVGHPKTPTMRQSGKKTHPSHEQMPLLWLRAYTRTMPGLWLNVYKL